MNNNIKIHSQIGAINSIRANGYFIFSVSPEGVFSMSSNPTIHAYEDSARKECKRLAVNNPHTMYAYARLQGAELVPKVTSVSI